MKNNPLPRLDINSQVRQDLLPFCRLSPGDIWEDPRGRHRVACLDATSHDQVMKLVRGCAGTLAIQDPPYNLIAFESRKVDHFIDWCVQWLKTTIASLASDAALYIWLGADQNHHYQPLPQFMAMMADFGGFESRSMITVRNQRGYGTLKNWMAVRQELLYYTKGSPHFQVQYTEIPKILRGYYKTVNGQATENIERSKSPNIRPGNVWVDIQQVFYRMQENVSGCYAQKPLEAIDRIVQASSQPGEYVIDFFAHSGSTLLSCERLGRRCLTADVDPVYCEITIRRLEQYRQRGVLGWQNGHPFEDVLPQTDNQRDDAAGPSDLPGHSGQQRLLI